mmetsp:Transcript_24113/g.46113  ORF Transcript_24113/g.46113 Transcript_24113/m.46113 type:complete len:174 (-) Transcript_24113:756-1277(-)
MSEGRLKKLCVEEYGYEPCVEELRFDADTQAITYGHDDDTNIRFIIHRSKLPIRKWRMAKFDREDLTKLRLYKSAAYPHDMVKIPKTESNKEGRLNCALCSTRITPRTCSVTCSTCLVPLCTTRINRDGETLATCFDLWHCRVKLQATGKEMNECLAKVRAERKVSGVHAQYR